MYRPIYLWERVEPTRNTSFYITTQHSTQHFKQHFFSRRPPLLILIRLIKPPLTTLAMSLLKLCALVFFTIISQISTYPFNPRPFDQFLSTRQPYQYASNDLLVDLGYEQYQGVHDEGTGLNTWKG